MSTWRSSTGASNMKPLRLPDDAHAALSYVEGALAASANRQEVVGETIERIDTIGASSKRAKHALGRLRAVARHFDAAPVAAQAQHGSYSDPENCNWCQAMPEHRAAIDAARQETGQ